MIWICYSHALERRCLSLLSPSSRQDRLNRRASVIAQWFSGSWGKSFCRGSTRSKISDSKTFLKAVSPPDLTLFMFYNVLINVRVFFYSSRLRFYHGHFPSESWEFLKHKLLFPSHFWPVNGVEIYFLFQIWCCKTEEVCTSDCSILSQK